MKIFIFYAFLYITSCSLPAEDELEKCIKDKVEKNGNKLVYFLQTKQHFINDTLLLRKLKITLRLPDGKEINRKDSIFFEHHKDGTWSCTDAVDKL